MFLLLPTLVIVTILYCFGQNLCLNETLEENNEEFQEISNTLNFSKSSNKYFLVKFKLDPSTKNNETITRYNTSESMASYKSKREDEGTERPQFPPNEIGKDWVEFKKKAREDGFNITEPAENPFAVYLSVPGPLVCSGTLLTLEWVLTTAHCLSGNRITEKSKVVVCAGGISYEKCQAQSPGTQMQYSSTFHVHENYKLNKVVDLGVLKTDSKFKPTETVNFIGVSKDKWEMMTPKLCKMTGFGRVLTMKKSSKDHLRKTHFLVVTAPCPCFPSKYRNTRMCNVPQDDVGPCVGDSGSGLIYEGHVVGVMSSGSKWKDYDRCEQNYPNSGEVTECGTKHMVTIFIQIFPELSWIYKYIPEIQPRTGLSVGMRSSVSSVFASRPLLIHCIFIYILIYLL